MCSVIFEQNISKVTPFQVPKIFAHYFAINWRNTSSINNLTVEKINAQKKSLRAKKWKVRFLCCDMHLHISAQIEWVVLKHIVIVTFKFKISMFLINMLETL